MKRLILMLMLLISSVLEINAQEPTKVRIKDKQTEVSLAGSNYLLTDRDDYENYRKITLSKLKTYIRNGVNTSNIGGINVIGWQPGQMLHFNNSGVLVPVDKPSGGGGGTSDVQYLNDLQDVNTTAGESGDVLTRDATGVYKPVPLPAYVDTDTKVQPGEGIEVTQSSPYMQEVRFKANNLQTEDSPVAANLYFITDAAGNSRRISYAKVKQLLKDDNNAFMYINKHESIFLRS